MKKWIFMAFMVMAAIFCAGWLDQPDKFDCATVEYKVESGDTIWQICRAYVNSQNRYNTLDEFVWYTRRDNGLLGAKFIQPGDVIKVNLYRRKGVLELWKNLNS